MTESATSGASKPANPNKRTYASYSTSANRKESDLGKGGTDGIISNTMDDDDSDRQCSPSTSKSRDRELSVMELTRDLMTDRQESTFLSQTSKSGIDWSFGDSDGENDAKNKNNNEDVVGDDDDDKSVEDGPVMTQPETQLSAVSDSETASLKGVEQQLSEDENRDDKNDAAEQSPETKAGSQPDSTDAASGEKETRSTLSKEEDEAEGASDDDDVTVAMSLDEDDASLRKTNLFDIDLSDDENDEELTVRREPPRKGRTKRTKTKQPKKPIDETDEDEDSEQKFEDAIDESSAKSEEKAEEQSTGAAKDEEEAHGDGLRRSRRTPKKRNLDFVQRESSPRKKSHNKPKKQSTKKKKKDKYGEQPDDDQLLSSTDYLFVQADKSSVTVADMYRSLEAEFDCKLAKATRKIVKAHLIALMSEEIQPSVPLEDDNDIQKKEEEEEEEEGEGEEGEEDTVGDAEEEDDDQISDQGDVESEYEADNDNDDEYDEGPKTKSRLKKKTGKPKMKKPKKPKRPNQRKAARAARLVEAMRLRKKQREELRIRNEEMQLNQTKEDQERALRIANKLDTNTEELRMRRLEDRLDLLGKLDQKRIVVLVDDRSDDDDDEVKSEADTVSKENGNVVKQEKDAEVKKEQKKSHDCEEESSEDESSDEDDLVIVGATKRIKPMAPLSTHVKASAIDILNRIKSPDRHLQNQRKKQSSGGNSMRARSALRNSLKQKQRTMGNMWLARELGYKTEEEHWKDCKKAAEKKRGLTILREQQRIKANERKKLRERLMVQDANEEYEEEEATLDKSSNHGEEEDEEMLMAKEIEKEESANAASQPVVEEVQSETPQNAESSGTIDVPVEKKQGTKATPSTEDSETATASMPTPKCDGYGSEPEDFGQDFSPSEEPLETQPPPPPQEETQEEDTELLETQLPPSLGEMPPPIAVVREVTADAAVKMSKRNEVEEPPKDRETPTPAKATEERVDATPKEDENDCVDSEDDGELEFVEANEGKSERKARNAGWQLMLQKEAEKLKKQKRRKGGTALVEQEAEEEEEEEVAGLEDFGFSIKKKKDGDDDDEDPDSLKVDEDDLKHVVDDLSDDEGDEEAGRHARKRLEQREEKERHKEMIRRMRDGYDGRRGGIAGGGVGARGMHRFDQLVAADNREDAKRLGLLNDDELDSDDDENDQTKKDGETDDDEAALLDTMLKDRFLHRSNVELENFSDDEDDGADKDSEEHKEVSPEEAIEAAEERTQERLAKRFAKRARMCRLEEMYADSQEFSQQRMIDEDESLKKELSQMTNGLLRNRSITSSRSSFSSASNFVSAKRQISNGSTSMPSTMKRQKSSSSTFGGSFLDKGGSLSLALRASRSRTKYRTSFLGGAKAGDGKGQGASIVHKNVALNHVVFKADSSRSTSSSNLGSVLNGKRKLGGAGGSFFRRATR